MGLTDIPDYPIQLLIHAKHEPWPNDDLGPLTKSIANQGLKNPLVVIDLDDNGTYTVADGHRRLRALQDLGIDTVPIRVANGFLDLLEVLPAYKQQADPHGISVPYWKREIAFGGIYRNVVLLAGRKYLSKTRSKSQMGRKTPLPGFGFQPLIEKHFGMSHSRLGRISSAVALLERLPVVNRPATLQTLIGRVNDGQVGIEQVYEYFKGLGPVNRSNSTVVLSDDQLTRSLSTLKVLQSLLADIVMGDVSNVSDEAMKKMNSALGDLRRSAARAIKALKREE